MLPAVELDDQPHLRAAEVRDVRTDRMLAAKLEAVKASITKERPQPALRLRLRSPQTPRVRSQIFAHHPPHPALSPSGGAGCAGGHEAPSWRAAPRSVFFMSMATVMGPTPPGTGVMARARLAADSKSTSPASLPVSRRFTPTSMTTAPSLIMSPVMKRG